MLHKIVNVLLRIHILLLNGPFSPRLSQTESLADLLNGLKRRVGRGTVISVG